MVSRDELKRFYNHVMPIFNATKLQPILFYGSLLGYTREKQFLTNDDDIDLLLWYDQKDLLMEVLKKNPQIIVKFADHRLVQITVSDDHKNNDDNSKDNKKSDEKNDKEGNRDDGLVIDIYFYNLINDDSILIKWDGFLVYPRAPIFPLKQVKFEDHMIFVPKNCSRVMELTYGDNWKNPTKKGEYSWAKCTKIKFLSDKKLRKIALVRGRLGNGLQPVLPSQPSQPCQP